MPEQVIVITRMRAKDGQEKIVQQLATSLATQTHAEPGSVLYDLYQNVQDKPYFILHEVWRGWEGIQEHMKTPHFNEFMAKVVASLVPPAADVPGPFEVMIATLFDSAHPPATPKVTVATRMKAKEGMIGKSQRAALSLVNQTHAEAGSISYNLFQNARDHSLFILFENWKGFGAVQVHMAQPYFGAFMGSAGDFLMPTEPGTEGLFEVMICVPYVPS